MAEPSQVLSGWERALLAAEAVKERLRDATAALNDAGVPYAVAGGNAVAAWVTQADEEAERNTRDVDLLIRRSDESAVKTALGAVGIAGQARRPGDAHLRGGARVTRGTVMFLFAGEKFQPAEFESLPTLDESVEINGTHIVALFALVRMKLTAYRLIDRVHLRDLIGVGQIDATWPARFPPLLGERLQQLLDNPNG